MARLLALMMHPGDSANKVVLNRHRPHLWPQCDSSSTLDATRAHASTPQHSLRFHTSLCDETAAHAACTRHTLHTGTGTRATVMRCTALTHDLTVHGGICSRLAYYMCVRLA